MLPPPEPKVWSFCDVPETYVAEIQSLFSLPPLVSRVLAARAFRDLDAVRDFLSPRLDSLSDPLDMADMPRAVDCIARAMQEGKRIAVYGDYDADGLTATALLVRCFRWLGHPAEFYIPDRLNEGYGMSVSGVETLASRGVELIVTVDNGIGCFEEVERARELGVEVVVTDHHQPGESLPRATAVVDPQRADCRYPFKELAGVGVAFKLAHALARHMGRAADEARAFLKAQLDLVALGTVADVMPLVGENRVLVLHGLRALADTDKVGLQVLAEALGMDGRPLTGENIAFVFGPRLNAAGRTGNADYALELLLTDSRDRARELAEHLDRLNVNRRSLESDVMREAMEQLECDPALLDGPVLVLAGDDWHQGIIGIVASRLLERFSRPAVILSIDGEFAKGSARSCGDFDIHGALAQCEDLLESYGGHRLAAGVGLHRDNLDALRRRINEIARQTLKPEQMRPRLELQATSDLGELTMQAVEQLDCLRPFGNGNPVPLLALCDCQLADAPQIVGGRHLKVRLRQPQSSNGSTMTALWFSCPGVREELAERLREADCFDVAGSPMINEWNGRRSVELNIKDIRFPD